MLKWNNGTWFSQTFEHAGGMRHWVGSWEISRQVYFFYFFRNKLKFSNEMGWLFKIKDMVCFLCSTDEQTAFLASSSLRWNTAKLILNFQQTMHCAISFCHIHTKFWPEIEQKPQQFSEKYKYMKYKTSANCDIFTTVTIVCLRKRNTDGDPIESACPDLWCIIISFFKHTGSNITQPMFQVIERACATIGYYGVYGTGSFYWEAPLAICDISRGGCSQTAGLARIGETNQRRLTKGADEERKRH